jgi:uncharacterized membrane protein YfcA
MNFLKTYPRGVLALSSIEMWERYSFYTMQSILVSLNMAISWAIGAYLGGEFGALTQSINPFLMFKWVIGLCVLFCIGHLVTSNKIENIINAK